jgi:Fic-DOC domain mobile mystery protein B
LEEEVKKFLPNYPPGATPLDPDEMNGLIPDYISTQAELNLLEHENILEAQSWAYKKRPKEVLAETFIRDLHLKMFKNVWRWAGKYRRSDKNIGVEWQKIPEELQKLCHDSIYWIENRTYSFDEIGARFHHRLVLIYAFPNGNGRHARFMTDLLLESHGQKAFSWGGTSVESLDLITFGEARASYLAALREADQKKFEKLLKFVRS